MKKGNDDPHRVNLCITPVGPPGPRFAPRADPADQRALRFRPPGGPSAPPAVLLVALLICYWAAHTRVVSTIVKLVILNPSPCPSGAPRVCLLSFCPFGGLLMLSSNSRLRCSDSSGSPPSSNKACAVACTDEQQHSLRRHLQWVERNYLDAPLFFVIRFRFVIILRIICLDQG
jgi:hypothetical protein